MAEINISVDSNEAAESFKMFTDMLSQVDEVIEHSHLFTREEILEILKEEHDLFKMILMASGMWLEMQTLIQDPESQTE